MEATELRFASDTNNQTLRLAGKPRLLDSVTVGLKDHVNYISQDALHQVNAIPLLVPVVPGKWSPRYLELNGPGYP